MNTIVALGAVTGMRSMAGLATLAVAHGGAAGPLMAAATLGEMVADKTALVGNRTDPLPLAGRAVLGAIVGVLVARERDQPLLVGGVLGAGAALVAAHLAYQVRMRLPAGTAAGLLEDGLVVAIASRYARQG